jgi:hypothetical protein
MLEEPVSVTIHFADDRQAVGTSAHVLYSVLRKPLTIEGCAQLVAEGKRMFERTQGRYVAFSVLEPSSASAAPPEVRKATAEFAASKILGAGIVIEGSGFRPAATRTLVAGMYLVTRKSYPHKIFEAPADGAAWLAQVLADAGLRSTARELADEAEAVRRAIK